MHALYTQLQQLQTVLHGFQQGSSGNESHRGSTSQTSASTTSLPPSTSSGVTQAIHPPAISIGASASQMVNSSQPSSTVSMAFFTCSQYPADHQISASDFRSNLWRLSVRSGRLIPRTPWPLRYRHHRSSRISAILGLAKPWCQYGDWSR